MGKINIIEIDINDPSISDELRREFQENTKRMLAGEGEHISLLSRPLILDEIYKAKGWTPPPQTSE
jgi:hypothetical protein